MRFTCVAFLILFSTGAWCASDQLVIGTLAGEPEYSRGYCSLQLPHEFANREGKYVFVSDFNGHAMINIGGEDMHLEFVKSKGPDVRQPGELGQRSTYSYAAKGLVVDVDFVVTAACPTQAQCKTTKYDAILTVKRGKAHKTVAAKAVCGT